ncbi:MAG: ATP-binding protein, partial [Longimicrobiales bacterium]
AKGHVSVRTILESGRSAPQLVLEVADTGHGVPEQMRAHLFEPFRSGKSGGLGLGLALSRQLIEANQGSISLRSTSRRGSVFQIRLPIYKVQGSKFKVQS